jgi:hypothetical protein
MTSKTHQLILGGLFIALGVLFPIFFHAVGLGSFMLPMFWPLAIGAFYLNPVFSILAGMITPMVSMLITGMPPAPKVYLMIGELAALCGVVCGLRSGTKFGTFWILLIGLLCSRFVLFVLATLLAPLIGLPGRAASVYLLTKGLPGVIAMLILIPLLLDRLKGWPVFKPRNHHA